VTRIEGAAADGLAEASGIAALLRWYTPAAALTKMGSITHSREMARGALLTNALEIEDMT
jgi:hypothetical protein